MSRPLSPTFNLRKARLLEDLVFASITTPIASYDEFPVYNMRLRCDIAISSTCSQVYNRPCLERVFSYSCGRQTVDAIVTLAVCPFDLKLM